jgi:hypothetical protein
MNGIIGLALLLSASTASSYKFTFGRPAHLTSRIPNNCNLVRVTLSKTQLSAEVKQSVEDENLNEQFKEWEAEEEETQRRELEDTVRQARADGTEDELPDYMMRCVCSITKQTYPQTY